ncbi:MAG: sugar phosphate nucleotidyltransferase [Candidatus Omnitrophota bacterium]
MKDKNIFLITRDASVKEAMKRMDANGEKTLFVVNDERKLMGSLTDGDVRRWILKGGDLTGRIDDIYNREPLSVREGYDKNDVKRLMLEKKIEWIPVLSAQDEIAEVLLWRNIFDNGVAVAKNSLDVPVVIMAGGKGTRLDPFTKILPKPLIPVGGKTIIEIIMDKFSRYGVDEFYISINHKAEIIKAYFKEIKIPHHIRYIEEELPLGTAGSLRFMRGGEKGSVMVSNCDIIVDCDYCEVMEFHDKNQYDISIVGSYRHFTIPYGICEIEKGGLLKGITEKPEYDFLVNTGMCVLKKSVLDLIPENTKFHITDLVSRVRETGGKVGVFPINAKSWIDVGEWGEYRKSVSILGLEQ